MVGSTAGKSGVLTVSRFAFAAGVTSTLANLSLIAFFAFRFGGIGGASFGPADDLVGSLAATAFMVPVALAQCAWLSDRGLRWICRMLGLSALAVLTVGGPLLVLSVLSFEGQAPIVTAAWLILCLWLFLVNRWLRFSGVLAPRLAWFGEFVSAGTAAGIAIFGLGVLMPGMSWRTQSFIDRRFYRSKYDARKTIEEFSAQLREDTNLGPLGEDLVGVIREKTMQPAHVSLRLRPDTVSGPSGHDGSDVRWCRDETSK